METAAEIHLPASVESVRNARHLVASCDLARERVADAQLVVSELVTNALLHGGLGPADHISLIISRDDNRLRIDVRDRATFDADSETFAYSKVDGRLRGLGVVRLLADRWRAESGCVTAWLDLSRQGP